MKISRLNLLFSLSTLSVILVTAERFSFTTKILLGPYNFLRLHELLQMSVVILLTILIPFLILREISDNFEALKSKIGLVLGLVFICGVYFYATGNGLHEVSSFNFNQYCNVRSFSGDLCSGFFFNDFYTGNILYFAGAGFMVGSLMLLEKINPNKKYQKRDLLLTLVNAVLYAWAIFAYAAFDRVLVGLVFSLIVMIFADLLFLSVRKNYLKYPVIIYTAATYTLGTIGALIVRFR